MTDSAHLDVAAPGAQQLVAGFPDYPDASHGQAAARYQTR